MADSTVKPCFVIPVYNHEGAIAATVESLREFGLPCVLVDDGCDAPCRETLQRIADAEPEWVHLQVREHNGGKGAAVKTGLRAALALGYSHGIQVDADGQHNPLDIPQFIQHSAANPGALVCGYPVYDQSVPMGRFIARYLTHVWVWINSRSLEIRDSMCGLRSYPLARTVALLDEEYTGDRMDFDPEVLVRWHWRRYGLIQLPVKVRYPVDGVSHFRGLQDNWLISAMHTRLFFGMLLRLFRRPRKQVAA
ncbi:glycosyltransferase family 2 protein [Microbulbifer bruguierae]|uniref:Glycosyltransferase family 2 protein n=1 Tax=Microbulbifer bruguierae TaxID=3029061 RepID=A0ABY8N8Q5_9GAMM|nr:glycosyltransferase family 2 protein [Microbulbifer bruguierae]WGL15278.1 glycosyltransferase family 2 protein [Microbulbifer bruguierae]